jgi:hypothetical protein
LKKLDLALIVSEHLPKAMKRLGWNAWTKRRNVPFQIGLGEGRTPFEALNLTFRANAVRESSSHPKRLARIERDTNYFAFQEWSQLYIRYSARKRLRRLLQEMNKGRSD